MTGADIADGVPLGITLVAASEPDIDIWVAVAMAVLLLIATSLLAWWRGRRPDPSPPPRSARILWAAVACSAGLTLILIPNDLRWANLYHQGFGLVLLFRFVGWLIPASMLFGTADLMLDYFRPRKSLGWLLMAPFLFTAFIVGILAASESMEMIDTSRTGPTPVAALLAAGLIWWSFLPAAQSRAPDERIANIFK